MYSLQYSRPCRLLMDDGPLRKLNVTDLDSSSMYICSGVTYSMTPRAAFKVVIMAFVTLKNACL